MKKGKIITQGNFTDKKYSIEFENAIFGPYETIYDRLSLYYNEKIDDRGSFTFPFKTEKFQNTEIFLETNDIVIAVGKRGSFSGESKRFVEIINLKTANKYRFYPDEVSLIYNAQKELVIYYTKSQKHLCLQLEIKKLEKISEKSIHLDAFFKLYYNHTNKNYGRLVFKANSRSHQAGYFLEEDISSDLSKPIYFHRKKFSITCDEYGPTSIDVWESSITGKF